MRHLISRRPRVVARWLSIIAVCSSFSACVSDTALLDENSAVAMRSVRAQARKDLACPSVDLRILKDAEVPGAPWGYLYSDYRIAATGCGTSAIYRAECRDEDLCDVSRESR